MAESTQGTPTAQELKNYLEYGVFVLDPTGSDRGTYLVNESATEIRYHQDDDELLKTTLREIKSKANN
jgi:hypothetical protein